MLFNQIFPILLLLLIQIMIIYKYCLLLDVKLFPIIWILFIIFNKFNVMVKVAIKRIPVVMEVLNEEFQTYLMQV